MRLSRITAVCGVSGLSCLVLPVASAAAPLVVLTPSFDVLYDSNVARSSRELAAERGLSLTDWRLSPGISVKVKEPLSQQSIFVDADVGYDFYARNRRLDRERVMLDGGANLHFSHCAATLTGNLSIRQSDLSELLDAGPVKNTEHYRKLSFDAQCGGPIGLIPFAGVARTWDDNSASARQFADYRTNDGHAGLAYAGPTIGELAVLAQISRTNYVHPSFLQLANGFKVFSVGGRFSRHIGSRLQGTATVFRTVVDPGAGLQRFTGLTTDISLDGSFSDYLQTHFSWRRQIVPVTLGLGSFALDSRFDLSGTYGLSTRLGLKVGGGLVHRQVEGNTFFTVPQIDHERREFAYARLTFAHSSRTSMDLELRHEVRRAEPTIFNYKSTSVGLTLRMGLG